MDRFVEEAQIEGQLTHPGIVPVYGLGLEASGRPFFAMKFVKGRTLSAFLAAGRGKEPQRAEHLRIFEQICQAVAYAHARGVLHRDLKPSNVLLGAYGEVLVVDWGFAKVLGGRTPGAPPYRERRSSRRSARGRGAPGRLPGRSWARPRTCPRSRPSATWTSSTSGATCSAWARSCARS